MLNELADQHGRNDGFLHRLLFSMARTTGGADWTEATIAQESQQAWSAVLARLRALDMQELDDDFPGYRVVHFTPEARERWVTWWNGHAAEIRGPDLPAPLIGPWGKLKGYCARLALVLHYLWLAQAEQEEGPVDAASVERAVRLIDYFKDHLRLVHGRLRQTPEDNQVFEVLDWVRHQGGRCTARELVRAKQITPTLKAKKVLAELAERGYGRLEYDEAANGRKVQWFVFDPT
jgi:hypothetical protein